MASGLGRFFRIVFVFVRLEEWRAPVLHSELAANTHISQLASESKQCILSVGYFKNLAQQNTGNAISLG